MARKARKQVKFKVRKSSIHVQDQVINKLQEILEHQTSVLLELERDLYEAKTSVKHWKDKYKDLEDEYEKLKKKKKK